VAGSGQGLSPDDVREALRAVIDPELGINIVDLGLIYDVEVGSGSVTVRYTLTTMGCGLGPLIESGISEVVSALPVEEVHTELVFRPPWSPDMMSAETKAMLGI
jgi:metal-sulfur cluster biosynthetic enzyme